jgi:small ubiquitin-related modifier
MTEPESKPDTQENAPPEAEAADPDRISLRVVSQDGGEVFFKIRKSTPLGKLMSAYCDRKGQSPSSIRFLFDGQRVNDSDTPKTLGMEDDDVIDALLQQTGGSFLL